MLKEYVVMDMEMTGLSPYKDKIIEIGAIKTIEGEVVEEFQTLINPNINISEKITDITGISNEMVKGKPFIDEILQDFIHFIGKSVIIGHNLVFDYSFLMQAIYNNKMNEKCEISRLGIDTLKIARKVLSSDEEKTLGALSKKYNIYDDNYHRALNDAYMTMKLYKILCEEFENETLEFKPEEYFYKPKKERTPSKREFEYVEKLMETLSISPEVDIYKMTQSELNRYADYIRLNQYTLVSKK